MSMVVIGSARADERGAYSGGAAGDQRQTGTPDYAGEVSRQSFYVHPKGWVILRAKDPVHAAGIAQAMVIACDNPNIGYSQSARTGIIKYGTGAKTPTNCDCSSLVRQCVREATGKDPGNFTTLNEAAKLTATGLFERMDYTDGATLYTGDVLVTKTKGHTVVVTSGASRVKVVTEAAVADVLAGKYGNGAERKRRLTEAGYDYAAVQAAINARLKAASVKSKSISAKGRKFIQQFESCKLTAYKDISGVWTIGWGTTSGVHEGMKITQAQADEFFTKDLEKFDKAVNNLGLSLTQNQHDALVSFAYNLGSGKLKPLIEGRDNQQIADAMLQYNKARVNGVLQPLAGLTRRRKAEREMFLS